MNKILCKFKFTKEECKKFDGMCVPATAVDTIDFDEGQEVEIQGDEYLVDKLAEKANKSGAKPTKKNVKKAPKPKSDKVDE